MEKRWNGYSRIRALAERDWMSAAPFPSSLLTKKTWNYILEENLSSPFSFFLFCEKYSGFREVVTWLRAWIADPFGCTSHHLFSEPLVGRLIFDYAPCRHRPLPKSTYTYIFLPLLYYLYSFTSIKHTQWQKGSVSSGFFKKRREKRKHFLFFK